MIAYHRGSDGRISIATLNSGIGGDWGRLAHLVSRFASNTRVIVDASSNPPVSRLKLLEQKKLESNHHVNKQKVNVTSSMNQMVIR